MMLDEIAIVPGIPLAHVAQTIEDFVDGAGLRVTLREPLAEFPGSIHWHIKRGKDAGTLEVTLFNRERRIGLDVRKGREGVWTAQALENLGAALREAVRNQNAEL